MKAFVVRHSNKALENFVPVSGISRDLFSADTWKRNNIVEVHFTDHRIGFVATTPDQLRLNLLGAQGVVSDLPFAMEKRIEHEKAAQ